MLQGLTYIQVLNNSEILEYMRGFSMTIMELNLTCYLKKKKKVFISIISIFTCFGISEKRPDLRGGFMLCFLDDGTGMDPSEYT